MVNRLEVAIDVIVDAESKWALRDLFDEHFVQPWHGADRVQIRYNGGSQTGARTKPKQSARRHYFEWYCDRPSKLTGEDCFHLEGRHVGVGAVRSVGIEHPRDLLGFDHDAYWREHLSLFDIDCERLGRLHLNRLRRERRRHPLLHETRNGFVYNIDRATGNALLRVSAAHPDQPYRSVQHFVDSYGRGVFLQRIHIPIVNMTETILPEITPPHKAFYDVSRVDLQVMENTTKIEGGECL